MSLFTALLLAAAPALTPPPVESKPVVPAARPAETTVSVGMGQVRKGGALGAGLSLTRGNALDAPAPGKTRLVTGSRCTPPSQASRGGSKPGSR